MSFKKKAIRPIINTIPKLTKKLYKKDCLFLKRLRN